MSVDSTSVWTTRLERLARAVDSVHAASNRDEALASLLFGLVQISHATRGHATLMDGDTVLCEVSKLATGESVRRDGDTRKLAARATLRFTASRGAKTFSLETQTGRAVLCSSVEDRSALGIVLDRFQSDADPNMVASMSALIALTPHFRTTTQATAETAAKPRAEAAMAAGSEGVGAVRFVKTVELLERDAIELALRQTGWKKDEAARRLGISRASIYMKVKKFGLQHPFG